MELFIRKRKIKDTLHFPARAIMDCSFNIKEKKEERAKSTLNRMNLLSRTFINIKKLLLL